MSTHKGTRDIFLGIENRMRKEEQFNRESMQGWRFAADAARITDERASSEDRKHTSGGGLVAIDCDLGECQRRYAGFCRVLLAIRTMDAEE